MPSSYCRLGVSLHRHKGEAHASVPFAGGGEGYPEASRGTLGSFRGSFLRCARAFYRRSHPGPAHNEDPGDVRPVIDRDQSRGRSRDGPTRWRCPIAKTMGPISKHALLGRPY